MGHGVSLQHTAPFHADQAMAQLTYRIGDATRPVGQGPKIIAHVCNDIGKWGSGFVLALSRRWPEPRARYLAWFGAPEFEGASTPFIGGPGAESAEAEGRHLRAVARHAPAKEPEARTERERLSARSEGREVEFALGNVQFVQVEPDLWVANLIGQHGIRRHAGDTPVRYPAIRAGLARVAGFASEQGASVHMPRIGAGLAGGDWGTIEPIVLEELVAEGIDVTVYDLP